MAVVLEGWCELIDFLGSYDISSRVTSFSGDYVSEDVALYIFSTASGRAKRIQVYLSGGWNSEMTDLSDPLPYSCPLYLVRKSDFSERTYPLSGYEESFNELAIGKYICNFEAPDVKYYWTPATTPLVTPTGLTADQITSNSARIGWNQVENASGYKVEYRRQGDTTWNE